MPSLEFWITRAVPTSEGVKLQPFLDDVVQGAKDAADAAGWNLDGGPIAIEVVYDNRLKSSRVVVTQFKGQPTHRRFLLSRLNGILLGSLRGILFHNELQIKSIIIREE